ncbi:Mov34/MPN/PAD-1 family protein [Amycolatopsis sp. CA-126428]|uniref:Mov34/MPN/PAD-1 family protein n=1 Tax=Amycolatopsis sp. CA-126428 TaxID=2073158 RepID=UPI0018EB2BC5|nr:Mov34/MPN/PAD-1 family protein [Amycolatopsis sp. CA-126428]
MRAGMTHAGLGTIRQVRLADVAARTIVREVGAASDGRETGGILLGDISTDGVADVRHAGDPGPAAVRTPASFLRDRAHAQQLADTAFEADGSIWIGEWHTHPTTEPVPSKTDIETYCSLLADPELQFTVILSIIIGPLPSPHVPDIVMIAWACTSSTITAIPVGPTDHVDGQGLLPT